jgi:hypothetical protein
MLALVLMWRRFAYFGMSVTGLFSPEFVDAPWSVARVLDLLSHVWLPAVVLGVAGTARLTRVMRANLLDELNKPYVTTARAKGLSEWRLVVRYPARLALNPLVSTIGWYLPALFSGSLIVATVMNLPNIGPLLLRALINQDMYLAGAISPHLLLPDRCSARCSPTSCWPGSIRGSASKMADERPAEERISVASNWTLMWWRFRRHRLAVVSAIILLGLYAVVLCPDFFSTQDPEATDARLAFIPVQRVRLFDGWALRPWVPGIVGKRNPVTLRIEWRLDADRRVPVRFFVTGHPYRLLGVVPLRVHLLGTAPDAGTSSPPARHRPARARSVVAPDARHADRR